MRIGVPVLLFAAVLALVAVGEQARRTRMALLPAQASTVTAQHAPAVETGLPPDIAAMDAELDRGLARMNAATGQAKLEAMAEVINAMARQRSGLRQALEAMQEQMTAAAAQGRP